MLLARLFTVLAGMLHVTMVNLTMMSCGFMIARAMLFSGFPVMFSCVLVVLGRPLVMLLKCARGRRILVGLSHIRFLGSTFEQKSAHTQVTLLHRID